MGLPLVFLLLTNTDFWDDPPRARHQVAEALSKRYRVYFVCANKMGLPRVQMMSARSRKPLSRRNKRD